jgi:hypothetical protein
MKINQRGSTPWKPPNHNSIHKKPKDEALDAPYVRSQPLSLSRKKHPPPTSYSPQKKVTALYDVDERRSLKLVMGHFPLRLATINHPPRREKKKHHATILRFSQDFSLQKPLKTFSDAVLRSSNRIHRDAMRETKSQNQTQNFTDVSSGLLLSL